MKLLRPNPPTRTMADDTAIQGLDAALMVLLFFGIGFALDRWLGTTPWLMVLFTLLAGVGYFLKFKYRYELAMDRHEAERQAKLTADRSRRA